MTNHARAGLGTAREVAEYLQISEGSLAQHRYRGSGPRFIKIGGHRVMYRWSDIEDYLDANTLSRSDRSRATAV
jgi:predicted DNA-binding transcriptional regulator AlpA